MKNRLKKIIVITLLLIQIFPYSVIFAAVSLKEAGDTIASYAKNCYTKSGTDFSYCHVWNVNNTGQECYYYRNDAYTSNKRYDNPECESKKNKLLMDCVGWTNYCIKNATGLDCGAAGNNNLAFVAGDSYRDKEYFKYYTKESAGTLQPGDLLGNSEPHIMVYVGDTDNDGEGEIVHCTNFDGLSFQKLSEYYAGYDAVYRLNDNALNTIVKENLNANGEILGLGNSSINSNSPGMSDFYYNGIPDGKYVVTKSVFSRIISCLADVFVFLVTLIPNIVRMVFVGWAAIVEILATATVKSITGDEKIESIPVTSTKIDSSDNITIEKIVFNQIGAFDVNFFNFSEKEDELKKDKKNEQSENEKLTGPRLPNGDFFSK